MEGREKLVSYLLKIAVVICTSVWVPMGDAGEKPVNQLNHIDYRVDELHNGTIVVTFATSHIVTDIRKTQAGLSIELLDMVVAEDKRYFLDVSDFATNVSSIDVISQHDSVILLVDVQGEYSYDYHLKDNKLEVVVQPSRAQQKKAKQNLLEKDGKKISLNFQQIPVRNVLQLIADYNDFNLVVSDAVQGNLTLRLDGVPWPQVLDIILQIKGLDKRIDGNVVLVAPKAELDLHQQQELEKLRREEQLGELESQIINIKFAKASEIAEVIGGTEEASMLSPRGSITIDERTNTLLIRDLKQHIKVIREIVEILDIPVKQVQIEARIVSINEGNLEELGVRWGITSTNGSNTLGASIEGNLLQAGLLEEDNLPVDDFLNVNLAATSANASSIAFQVAKLGSDMLLDLELSALQRESKAEVISSPRLITTNKKPAYIEQGTEIPYLESSSSGATSVSFKKAVLSLKVTPQITPDNQLVLDLNVTQDRPGEVVKTGTGEAVAIHTQRIGTQVLVNNGETIVLGGIFQHSVTDTIDKVPLLGDLPLLGALFRRNYQQMGKSELLIFVTPKVVIE